MRITEEHHAYLIGSFFKVLNKEFGDLGVQIFVRATQTYAEQRGYRMALRASLHGFELDYLGYFTHSEWAPTEAAKKESKSFEADHGDFVTLVYECPWLETFQAMDAVDCAKVYCSIIDTHLVKGFNPELVFEVTSFLHSDEHCTFCWRKANFNDESVKLIKEAKEKFGESNVMPFAYHTGHVWKTFKEVIEMEQISQAGRVMDAVKTAVEQKYGLDVFKQIQGYEMMDFNALPEG